MLNARGDRGTALSVWVALALVFLIICVGIGVDATGRVAAEQDVRQIAQQAARAGAQQVRLGSGAEPPQLNDAAARQAATAYLAASSWKGEVTVSGTTVIVRVTGGEYRTKFLSIIGINSLAVSAESSADNVRAVDGAPR